MITGYYWPITEKSPQVLVLATEPAWDNLCYALEYQIKLYSVQIEHQGWREIPSEKQPFGVLTS